MDRNLKDRRIILSNNVNCDSMERIIEKIFEITYDDQLKANEFKDIEIKPIELYINSFGGSCYDGMALIDLIRINPTPIHTYSFGSSMSMGFMIFLAGEIRYMGKNSTLMYHECSDFVWDKLTGIKMSVIEGDRLQKIYDEMVRDNSTITQEKLDSIKSQKCEWYIGAEDAVKLGLAHYIL